MFMMFLTVLGLLALAAALAGGTSCDPTCKYEFQLLQNVSCLCTHAGPLVYSRAGPASLSPHMPHPLERLACETSPLAAHPILLKYTIGAVDIQIIGPKTPYRGKSQFSFSGSVLYPVIACTVHDILASFPGHRLGPGNEANDTHTHTCTRAHMPVWVL